MTGRLAGRVAVVTGASRGIGKAIACRLGAEGATVVVAARTVEATNQRLPGTIGETAEAVRAAGGQAVAVPTDLSRAEDREALIRRAEAGPVDILVNNAAVTYFLPASELAAKRFDLMVGVQVWGPLHLAQLALPGMRRRRQGWILNISSVAARHPHLPPDERAASGAGTVYGMCKAALILCSGDPHSLTGRIAYSQDLLDELEVVPAGTGG